MMMKSSTRIMSHFSRPRQEKWDIMSLGSYLKRQRGRRAVWRAAHISVKWCRVYWGIAAISAWITFKASGSGLPSSAVS